MFEIVDNGIIGLMNAPVKRIEYNDDNTQTIIIDHWPGHNPFQHPDDIAIDQFAAEMKARMAEMRARDKGGWDNPNICPFGLLYNLCQSNLDREDYVDVGNFAMMLRHRSRPEKKEG